MIIAVVAAVAALVLLYFVFVRPMMMSGDARILLVASDVLAQAGGKSKLESYLSSANVAVVPYNYDRVATYAELGDLVKATGASRVRSVGIMYHTPNRYNLKCFASDPEKSTVSGSLESFEPFRRFVVALRGAYGVEDVDLVSCDVVSAERNVLASLDFNGARVNASTNTTGQVKQGPVGDWVLEAGNVNLIGRYFNATITRADIALVYGNSNSPFQYLNPAKRVQLLDFIDGNLLLSTDCIINIDSLFNGGGGAQTNNTVEKMHIDAYKTWRRQNPKASNSNYVMGISPKFAPGANGPGTPQK
jgi:hypothetical protein